MLRIHATIHDDDVKAMEVMSLSEIGAFWVDFAGLSIVFNSREQAYEFAASFLKKLGAAE